MNGGSRNVRQQFTARNALWTRKSEQWEEERRTTQREISRIGRPKPAATGEKILELLSNCTFDRGSVCPTYAKPFDLFAQGNETGNWRGVWDEFRNFLITTT
jgi:hypothetical protein